MKKILALILIIALVFTFSACKNKETSSHTETNSSEITEIIEQDIIPDYGSSQTDSTPTTSTGSTQTTSTGSTPTTSTGSTPQSSHTHSFSEATCTEPAKCSCGETKGAALGHNYKNATCTEPKTCKLCGKTEGNPIDHNFVNGKCTLCGKLNRAYLIEDITPSEKSEHANYIKETLTDVKGNTYYEHYSFYSGLSKGYSDISFQLDGKYKSFSGTTFLTTDELRSSNEEGWIKIYGDGRLLFETGSLTNQDYTPKTVNVNTAGVSVLKISIQSFYNNNGCLPYLTDAYLEK